MLSVQTSGISNFGDNEKALNISSTMDKQAGEVIIKAVNVTNEILELDIELQGLSKVGPQAKEIILSSNNLDYENSLQEPRKIYPTEKVVSVNSSNFSYGFQHYSLTILRIPIEHQ